MSETPLVSIILPVFNGERTLKATLDSLLAQSYSHFELLIGIDGSKDGSKAIAEAYHDARIQIFEHPKNLGLANNLNALIEKVSLESEFIAIAEQDDVYVPERLAWQIAVFEEHPEVGLVSGIVKFIGSKADVLFPGLLVKGEQFPKGEELFRFLYINQLKVVNTCMMIRKQVHKDHQLRFRNTYGNFNVDWDYVLRFTLVSQVYGIPKVLVQMNRGLTHTSVTRDRASQHLASRLLLKDFKMAFPNIIDKKIYHNALKQHRKIELGSRNKWSIVFYGLYYTFLYIDFYFLKYIAKRTLNYFKD